MVSKPHSLVRQPLACYYQINIKNTKLRRIGSTEYATGRRNMEKAYIIIILTHISSSANPLLARRNMILEPTALFTAIPIHICC